MQHKISVTDVYTESAAYIICSLGVIDFSHSDPYVTVRGSSSNNTKSNVHRRERTFLPSIKRFSLAYINIKSAHIMSKNTENCKRPDGNIRDIIFQLGK